VTEERDTRTPGQRQRDHEKWQRRMLERPSDEAAGFEVVYMPEDFQANDGKH
jgi:hypothetical protein